MTDITELLDAPEDMARQHCHTSKADVTDSGALSANADALLILARFGRFRLTTERGRMVVGYWPENDPEKKA